jgi:hypothetical protein
MNRIPLFTGVVALACIVAVWRITAAPPTDPGIRAADLDSEPAPADQDVDVSPLVAPAVSAGRSEGVALEEPGAPAGDAHDHSPKLPPEEDDFPEIWDEPDYDQEALLADLGLASDTPVAVLVGQNGPPDPLELGTASVRLSLFDEESGDPMRSGVLLWRLAAPGNEYWLVGDQAVAHESVPQAGRTFTDLPAGEYRAVCTAERQGAPHQASFFVGGATKAALFLTLPGERPTRLELTSGEERLTRIQAYFQPLESYGVKPKVPDWVSRRRMRNPPEVSVFEDYAMMGGPPFEEEWITLLAGPDGFDLEAFPEDSRTTLWQRRIDLRTDDGRQIQLVLRNNAPGDVLRVTAEIPGS